MAIEEPEAHLHPEAVHELRTVLSEIAQEQQVVITTHSPLLVERNDIHANVIVSGNKAGSAGSLQDVRQILGVRVPDNLQSADVVLLVEGESDRQIVEAVFKEINPFVARSLHDGSLRIVPTRGASNIGFQFRKYFDDVCHVHVLLDNDKEGKKAIEAVEKEKGFTNRDATVLSVLGMDDTEIEDFFNVHLLHDLLRENFNVVFDSFDTCMKKKFTLRMRDHFKHSGQAWTDQVEKDLKILVSKEIAKSPATLIATERRTPLDNLAQEIERKLRSTSSLKYS